MFFLSLIRGFLIPLLAAGLSLVIGGSGCMSRAVIPAAGEETVLLGRESGFLLAELEENAICRGDLILVNGDHAYLFPQEQTLCNVYENKSGSYYIRSMDLALDGDTLGAVNRMLDDFLAQGGSKTVNLVAGWRSEETQRHLFDQSAARYGPEHATRYVASPGGSEHHTGLAVDFSLYFPDGTSADFTGEGEYRWIMENCCRYGLIARYQSDKEAMTGIACEPWHFRYVGRPHAEKMAELGLCLEEYIEYLRAFPFGGEHLFIDCGGERYEVWYEPGSAVHVPIEGEYSVSGNNIDGLIVTRKLLDGQMPPEYTGVNTNS